MTEVAVTDVVLRAPKNEEAKWLASGKEYKLGWSRVILLTERSGSRILPIWVGPVEEILSRWRSTIWLCSDQ